MPNAKEERENLKRDFSLRTAALICTNDTAGTYNTLSPETGC